MSNPFYDFAKLLHTMSGQKMKTCNPANGLADVAKAYQAMARGDRKSVRKFCDKVRK